MTGDPSADDYALTDQLYRAGFRLLAVYADEDAATFEEAVTAESLNLGGTDLVVLAVAMAGKELARTMHEALRASENSVPPESSIGDVFRVQELRTSRRRNTGRALNDLDQSLDEIERQFREDVNGPPSTGADDGPLT